MEFTMGDKSGESGKESVLSDKEKFGATDAGDKLKQMGERTEAGKEGAGKSAREHQGAAKK